MYFDWRLAPAWECLSSEPGLSASVPLAGPFCLVALFDWASEICVSVSLAGPRSQCGNQRFRFILLGTLGMNMSCWELNSIQNEPWMGNF